MNIIYCTSCGKSMSESALACPSCGHPTKVTPMAKLKSKTAFVLFALFLGGFGIHRMYLEEWGTGIVYFLLFWTGIPAIFALFEAVIIGFRKNDPRFE